MIFGIEKLLDERSYKAVEASSACAEKFGINIFLIGGIVRDFIMNNKIKDIDIAVEGDAVEFSHFLQKNYECEVIAVQENLRTAKVRFNSGIEIDFASTREELYSNSGVLPVAHNFGCALKEDVKRRDFTINTLAIKLTGDDKGQLIDYYGGYEDILNKKIKILHNNSFIDDPSRIIRAIKFKERFDFNYEQETYSLMQKYLENPDKNMPLERIKSELKQYFAIEKSNIYQEIIKTNAYKLISDNPIKNIFINRLEVLSEFNLYQWEDIPFIYFAALVVNSDFSSERLNLSAAEKKILFEVNEMISQTEYFDDNMSIYHKYSGKENLSLAIYYLFNEDKSIFVYLKELQFIKVLTNGQDLIELGLKPSKYFSEIFDSVLKEKLNDCIHTKEEELIYIKDLIKKESR